MEAGLRTYRDLLLSQQLWVVSEDRTSPLVNVGLTVARIGPVLRLSAWPSGSCSVGVPGTAAIVQREAGLVISTTGVHFRLGIALDVCC